MIRSCWNQMHFLTQSQILRKMNPIWNFRNDNPEMEILMDYVGPESQTHAELEIEMCRVGDQDACGAGEPGTCGLLVGPSLPPASTALTPMEDTGATDNNHVGGTAFSSVVPHAFLTTSSCNTLITFHSLFSGGA